MDSKEFAAKSIELMLGCQQLIDEYGLEPKYEISCNHLHIVDIGEVLFQYEIGVEFFYTDLRGYSRYLATLDYNLDGRWTAGEDRWKPELFTPSFEEAILVIREIYTKRVKF